jgi:hypothetical protein
VQELQSDLRAMVAEEVLLARLAVKHVTASTLRVVLAHMDAIPAHTLKEFNVPLVFLPQVWRLFCVRACVRVCVCVCVCACVCVLLTF